MIETRLLARLLGVRLLRVEGTVVVSPGRLVVAGGEERRPVRAPAVARARTAGVAHAGDGLAQAAQLLAESEASLRRTRG